MLSSSLPEVLNQNSKPVNYLNDSSSSEGALEFPFSNILIRETNFQTEHPISNMCFVSTQMASPSSSSEVATGLNQRVRGRQGHPTNVFH